MKNVVILGSSGSIGENALRVIRCFPDRFRVVGLAVRDNYRRALEQASEFGVRHVAVADEDAALKCSGQAPENVTVSGGSDGLDRIASLEEADIVVVAVVGMAGLKPVLTALRAGKDIALATKETLVAAGGIVMKTAAETGSRILPVDSEHSAIFQCLDEKPADSVKRILLTASGGPFSGCPDLDLEKVTVEQALNHPRWNMGRKVSIDSATMMNKGLEIMEAHWLFSMPVGKIEVVIHPESIIHSMVEFVDGNIIAQMSCSDMRFAIQYALTWPERVHCELPRLDLAALGSLTFESPDSSRFPCLALARSAADTGGTMPAVLNAANEIAVEHFLGGSIAFPDIWRIIEQVMNVHTVLDKPGLEDIMAADCWARGAACELIAKRRVSV